MGAIFLVFYAVTRLENDFYVIIIVILLLCKGSILVLLCFFFTDCYVLFFRNILKINYNENLMTLQAYNHFAPLKNQC